MKSLDRISLDEQTRLVSRYVAGDLSRSERAEFEAWLVASPELAGEVEMERRMRRGIASAARRGWLRRSAPAAADTGRDKRWQIALAASVVLSFGLVLSLVVPRTEDAPTSKRPELSAGGSKRVASTRSVRLNSVRGEGDTPDVSVTIITCSRRNW